MLCQAKTGNVQHLLPEGHPLQALIFLLQILNLGTCGLVTGSIHAEPCNLTPWRTNFFFDSLYPGPRTLVYMCGFIYAGQEVMM